MHHVPRLAILALLLSAATVASAEVLDADKGGFTVRHRVVLPVDRAAAWGAVIDHVGDWWNGDHTMSGDAANLSIEPEPLGCFCERLGEDGGLAHLTVTFVNPGVILRMTGGLGPLGLMGVNGNLTLEFDEADDDPGQTTVTLRYAVGGYLPDGLDAMAGPVDGVLGEQMRRLQAFTSGNLDE